MGIIPILAALIAGALIGSAWEARRSSRRRRFNAIVEGTESPNRELILYRGVYYETQDNDAPLPDEDL